MNIIEFLEARIAEDEVAARQAIEERFRAVRGTESDMSLQSWPDVGVPAVLVGPERVLADSRAKRTIAYEHRSAEGEPWQTWRRGYCQTCADWDDAQVGEGPPNIKYPCDTLKALAAVYKDHPDYQQEWA